MTDDVTGPGEFRILFRTITDVCQMIPSESFNPINLIYKKAKKQNKTTTPTNKSHL